MNYVGDDTIQFIDLCEKADLFAVYFLGSFHTPCRFLNTRFANRQLYRHLAVMKLLVCGMKSANCKRNVMYVVIYGQAECEKKIIGSTTNAEFCKGGWVH